MSIDPIKAAKSIKETYLSYLNTTFNIKDPELNRQFNEALMEEKKMVKGPILEVTPPYLTGESIDELIKQNVLSKEFRLLNTDALPIERPLYVHQVKAIKKVVCDKRNIVVSTGTGSGKTETFLIPILNYLMRQREEKGTITAGVRALLLYPMNALVNDQLKRLRALLKNYKYITFGRYTGETPEKEKDAVDEYLRINGVEPPCNEIISRERMREEPPHILITNYAMLEYMLLRPGDNVFFDGELAKDWKFIVIDEAHTYSGAKGIEMSMLLRRLKERVTKGEIGKLQCIATSATIGGGEADFPKVAQFATNLFGEEFQWVEGDDSRQDIIKAERDRQELKPWGQPDKELYSVWKKRIDEGYSVIKLAEEGINLGVPRIVISEAINKCSGCIDVFLHEVLKGDNRFIKLRNFLQENPCYLEDVAEKVFDDVGEKQYLVDMVALCVRARTHEGDMPLLPARYHYFVKSIEGVYVSFQPEKKLYLERQKYIGEDKKYPVFEISTCRQCGSLYIVGVSKEENGRRYLEQMDNEFGAAEFYLVMDEERDLIEDEDEDIIYATHNEVKMGQKYVLCTRCGAIDREDSIRSLCNCKDSKRLKLIFVSKDKEKLYVCPACGRKNPKGVVRRFLTGPDATGSVLATALYQNLESDDKHKLLLYEEESAVALMDDVDNHHNNRNSFAGGKKDKRSMLIFSDSRQDAAFFAPYLDRTFNQILRRRIILKAIRENLDNIINDRWRLEDLIFPIIKLAEENGIFDNQHSVQSYKVEVWKWILYEFLSIDRNIGLEGLGLLSFSPVIPVNFKYTLYNNSLGLRDEEIWTLLRFLLDSFRIKGAITYPENVDYKDEFFEPRNRLMYFKQKGSNSQKHILSWNSDSSHINSRLDYVRRIAQRTNPELSIDDCRKLLDDIWVYDFAVTSKAGIWKDYFEVDAISGEGSCFRAKYNMWELDVDKGQSRWYICDKCHRMTRLNIRDVCPTFGCEGHLSPCDPFEVYRDNHYFKLYNDEHIYPLKVEEHTAQIENKAAAELQTRFIQGEINALSCSTTFELGVDVGELETVFLRNMPPSPSNYIQRAGRAGRRTSSTAFVLTFAQRKPHDISYFSDPSKMVSGKINAPHFKLKNEKIIKRHIYSVAIASFWQKYNQYYGDEKVKDFLLNDGVDKFFEYLRSRPQHLLENLRRIVPFDMQESLGINNWSWVDELLGDKGVLRIAHQELINDIDQLEKAIAVFTKERNFRKAEMLQRIQNTMMDRPLIGYLSSKNVLPKYGFPVDVVELKLPIQLIEEAKRLELQRDMKIAISEYAPDSEVVAGGKLWRSRYLALLPEKTWPRYFYAICDYCNNYTSFLVTGQKKLEECPYCHHKFVGKKSGQFVEPIFGFIAEDEVKKPGDERPQKTYSTRVYYSGKFDGEVKEENIELKGLTVTATFATKGKLAVINDGGNKRFYICNKCGYASLGREKRSSHKTSWGMECKGKLEPLSLGHEFLTDILLLRFDSYRDAREGFWESLLYAIIEGASFALDIERQDLDGCLYAYAGDKYSPEIVIFDNVPGGAGHAARIGEKENLMMVLEAALEKLKKCECGGEKGDASCYGCLRNYTNQYCHDVLNRGMVIDFLSSVL